MLRLHAGSRFEFFDLDAHVNTARHRQSSCLSHPTTRQVRQKRALIEILVGVADVGVFRLVTDLRWKFRVTGVNVRNVRRQNGVIAFPPNWKRKRQNLDKTSHVSCRCASQAAHNAITSPRGITFCLVDLIDRHKKLSRSPDKIRKTATELARWAIVVRRRVLNIGEGSTGKSSNRCER